GLAGMNSGVGLETEVLEKYYSFRGHTKWHLKIDWNSSMELLLG
ncbi:hypothetical protein U9M48_024773, partial [Paspalum notatum var. saurae]